MSKGEIRGDLKAIYRKTVHFIDLIYSPPSKSPAHNSAAEQKGSGVAIKVWDTNTYCNSRIV
jgi:hypothetical protein